MKYLKTLALLISLLTLASCDQGFEDFSTETNSLIEDNGTKGVEPTDSTTGSNITIIFEEPQVTDIDFDISIP